MAANQEAIIASLVPTGARSSWAIAVEIKWSLLHMAQAQDCPFAQGQPFH